MCVCVFVQGIDKRYLIKVCQNMQLTGTQTIDFRQNYPNVLTAEIFVVMVCVFVSNPSDDMEILNQLYEIVSEHVNSMSCCCTNEAMYFSFHKYFS